MSRKKDPFSSLRRDMRADTDESKIAVYEQITLKWLNGSSIKIKEHKSGFPAVTVDCDDIHILTDCLSVEEYNRQLHTFLATFYNSALEGGGDL